MFDVCRVSNLAEGEGHLVMDSMFSCWFLIRCCSATNQPIILLAGGVQGNTVYSKSSKKGERFAFKIEESVCGRLCGYKRVQKRYCLACSLCKWWCRVCVQRETSSSEVLCHALAAYPSALLILLLLTVYLHTPWRKNTKMMTTLQQQDSSGGCQSQDSTAAPGSMSEEGSTTATANGGASGSRKRAHPASLSIDEPPPNKRIPTPTVSRLYNFNILVCASACLLQGQDLFVLVNLWLSYGYLLALCPKIPHRNITAFLQYSLLVNTLKGHGRCIPVRWTWGLFSSPCNANCTISYLIQELGTYEHCEAPG